MKKVVLLISFVFATILSKSQTGFPKEDIITIDVGAVYSVVADGSTDNATALMKMRSDLSAVNGKLYHLIFPPNGEIRYSNNRWLFGIERFIVEGNGSIFRPLYDGADEKFWRPFFVGELWQTNTLAYNGSITRADSYLFNSATSGATSITTTTAADAGEFDAGDKILLWGYEQVAVASYPPGSRYFEWHEVVSADAGTGVIVLKMPLKYSWNEDWWDVDDFIKTGEGSGKPRILKLNRADRPYNLYAEFRNCIFGNSTGGEGGALAFANDHIVFKNCVQETASTGINYTWPSENRLAFYEDCTLNAMETDKILGKVVFTRTNFIKQVGGGIANEVSFIDCNFSESVYAAATEVNYINCVMRMNDLPDEFAQSITYQPERFPQKLVTYKNITFSSGPDNDAGDHINLAPLSTLTIDDVSGTNMLFEFGTWSDSHFEIVQRLGIGTFLYKTDGTKGGYVTDIYFDPTYNSNQGAFVVEGTWNVAPVAAETWAYTSVENILDLGGHTVTDGKRLMNEQTLRYLGNTSTSPIKETVITTNDIDWSGTDLELPVGGRILSIEAYVGKVYNGTDAEANVWLLTPSYDAIMKINTEIQGLRTLNQFEAQGTQSGDILSTTHIQGFKYNLRFYARDDGGGPVASPGLPQITIKIKWIPNL